MEKLEKRNNKRKELIELSGLYGWTHQYNDRSHITFSSDPRYGTKEHNYISDLDNGDEIINFLKSHKNTNYYKGIKSFEFQAFPGKTHQLRAQLKEIAPRYTFVIEIAPITISTPSFNTETGTKTRTASRAVNFPVPEKFVSDNKKVMKRSSVLK